MNQEKSLLNILNQVKTTLEGGIPVSGNLLTDIKGDLDIVKDCVVSGNKLKINLCELNDSGIARNAGNTDDGTIRVINATDDVNLASIASNIANINTNIVPAYDPGNGRVQVDQQTLNGFAIDAGAGNLSAGTQRICIASDDNLTGTIAIQTGRVAGCVDLGNNLLNVDNSMVSGTAISVNSGTTDAGTQRIVIATDDTNLSNISAILSDVWDPVNHYLNVHIIP